MSARLDAVRAAYRRRSCGRLTVAWVGVNEGSLYERVWFAVGPSAVGVGVHVRCPLGKLLLYRRTT